MHLISRLKTKQTTQALKKSKSLSAVQNHSSFAKDIKADGFFFFNVVTFIQLREGNDKTANQQSNVVSPEWSQPVVHARHSNLIPLSLRCHFVCDRCSDLSLFCASFGPSSVSYNTHCHSPHRNAVYHGSILEAHNYWPLGHICLQPANRTTKCMYLCDTSFVP